MKIVKGALISVEVLLGLTLIAVLVSIPFYRHEMKVIRQELTAGSKTIDSPYGVIEYVEFGSGTPVLISHGTMGGYDLGVLQALAYTGEGYRFIIPSRFGYLRSDLPTDGSFENQADCFAFLLDELGVDRVVVQGMSAGGVPALQFAIRHPDRCMGLQLLSSITYAPPELFQAQELPLPDSVYNALLKNDYLFWLLQKLAPGALQSIYGASPELIASINDDEQSFINDLMNVFQPVSDRYAGWKQDGENIDSLKEMPLETIKMPTLIISAKDDLIAPQVLSTYTKDQIAGSELVSIETGGHVLLGNLKHVRDVSDAFLEDCTKRR